MKISPWLIAAGVGVAALLLSSKKLTTPEGAAGGAGGPVSSATPSNSYGITDDKSVRENLDAANAAIAQGMVTPDVQKVYAQQISQAASSNRAVIIPASSKTGGKEITVGPTGNVYYTDPATGKGVYTPGKTSSLGVGSFNTTAATRQAAAQVPLKAALAANVKPVGSVTTAQRNAQTAANKASGKGYKSKK